MPNGPFSGASPLAAPLAALPALSRAAAAVAPAIATAAQRAGVDFGALYHTARLESGFNPAANAKTSSATGLFQFIDATWLQMLKRHGPTHGLQGLSKAQALALRHDAGISSLMAAEHMADNARALEAGLGRPADRTDLYLAHFLGLGGAMRFLRGLAEAPQTAGAALFPSAARANRAIFHAGGVPRTLEQIHQLLGARIAGEPAGGQPGALSSPVARAAARAPHPAGPALPFESPPGSPLAPADMARVAYLMLAELGG